MRRRCRRRGWPYKRAEAERKTNGRARIENGRGKRGRRDEGLAKERNVVDGDGFTAFEYNSG